MATNRLANKPTNTCKPISRGQSISFAIVRRRRLDRAPSRSRRPLVLQTQDGTGNRVPPGNKLSLAAADDPIR